MTLNPDAMAGQHSSVRLVIVQTTAIFTPEVRVVYRLLEAASTANIGFDVFLIQGVSGPEQDSQVAREFRKLPRVNVHPIPVGRLGQSSIGRVRRLLKVADAAALRIGLLRARNPVMTFHPDVIYSAQRDWDLYLATSLAAAARVPQVIHLHYNPGPWFGESALQALRHVDGVIAVSDFTREQATMVGVAPEHTTTLYNSMPAAALRSEEEYRQIRLGLRRELGLSPDATLIGMFARFSIYKGQDELLQAAIPVLRTMPNAALVFAGSEDDTGRGLEMELKNAADAAHLASQVCFLGYRSDVPELLDAIDIFAHPSRFEPCSLSVLEGMAHGLPVAAWREGGTAELVVPEKTGLLVDPLDRAGLTRALERLLVDRDLREVMGINARKRVEEKFSPRDAANRFVSILESVRMGQMLHENNSLLVKLTV